MIDFFNPLKKLEKQRIKALEDKSLPDELRPFYERPLPSGDTLLKDCKFCSIDFETTGLNFDDDVVISMGGISFIEGKIDFNTAFHFLLKIAPEKIKSNTAIINQITPEQLCDGKDPHEAMLFLMDKLSGGLVLTHCKVIESTFIRNTLKIDKKFPLPMIFLDTMEIEKTLIRHRGLSHEDVRLAKIREARGFPAYDGHNALSDSLATAEVFLAQVKDIFGKTEPTVEPVFKRSN